MSRGDFGLANHVGSILLVTITALICLLCLLLQLCKRFTRKEEVQVIQALQSSQLKIPTVEETTNKDPYLTSTCSIGWDPVVTTTKEQFLANRSPIGFNSSADPNTTSYSNDQTTSNENTTPYSSRSDIGIKVPTKGIQIVPKPVNSERAQPGFKDHILFGGPKRAVGWSSDT